MTNSKKAKRFQFWINVVLILITLSIILPFVLVFISSLTDENTLIRNGYSFFPEKFSFYAYSYIIRQGEKILRAYGITVFVTIVGTVANLAMSALLAYPLSIKKLPYRRAITFFVFFTMLFNGGLVPTYLMYVNYLHIKNTIWALILPLMFSVWNMIIAKTFMSGIPAAITESAKIDGANDIVIFIKLILPLSKPLIATLSLFSALAYWNDWYNCMLYITKDNMFTLQYYLQRMLGNAEAMRIVAEKSGIALDTIPLESMKMAMTVVATGPIVLLYPFVQRYFVKGLTIGAVKG